MKFPHCAKETLYVTVSMGLNHYYDKRDVVEKLGRNRDGIIANLYFQSFAQAAEEQYHLSKV